MMTTHDTGEGVVKSKDVLGVTVINSEKEKLGKIEEIVLDKRSGKTCYVVLSFGGMLGLGDKLFALPWEVISYDQKEEKFVLKESKEKLKKAPGFDKDRWPDMADKKWGESIHNYYGVAADRTERSQPPSDKTY